MSTLVPESDRLPASSHRPRLSFLHRSALDRLIPVMLLIALLWLAVGWAMDRW